MNSSPIKFSFHEVAPVLDNRNALKLFLIKLFRKEATRLEALQYVFCADSYLLKINREFLAHDEYTDIISFNLARPNEPVSGEIYISIERVRENAINLGMPFKTELHRVIFHGALHLCGYKDKSKKDRLLMRKKEDEYLKAYGLFHVKQ
jgi:probable rRNA maturation factor